MKLDVDVSSVLSGVDKAKDDINGDISAVMEGMAVDVVRYAKENTPFDRGHLKAGIDYEMLDPYTFSVSDSVDYGIFFEFGTEHHLMPLVDDSGKFTDLGRWAIRQRGMSEDEVRKKGSMWVHAEEYRFMRGGLDYAVDNLKSTVEEVKIK